MADEASAPDPGGDLAPRDEHEPVPRDEHGPVRRDEHDRAPGDEPVPGGAGLRASHDDRDRVVEVLRRRGP